MSSRVHASPKHAVSSCASPRARATTSARARASTSAKASTSSKDDETSATAASMTPERAFRRMWTKADKYHTHAVSGTLYTALGAGMMGQWALDDADGADERRRRDAGDGPRVDRRRAHAGDGVRV